MDVVACKCLSERCNCQLNKKVLEREKQFLFDQRNNRKIIIGSVEGTITKIMLKNGARVNAERMKLECATGNISVN